MIFERLDGQSLKVLFLAEEQCSSRRHRILETELILLGLTALEGSAENDAPFTIGSSTNSLNLTTLYREKGITLERVEAAISNILIPVDNNSLESTFVNSSVAAIEVVESGVNYTTAEFSLVEGVSFSARVVRVLERAEGLANCSQQHFINTLHILLGLIEEGQDLIDGQPSNAVKVLEYLGVNVRDLQIQITQILRGC